jgi:diketogulonate reductase-like aldo/keto reductase
MTDQLMSNNVVNLPNVGLGTYKVRGEKLKNALKAALNFVKKGCHGGYDKLHIDTATLYKNEETIGEIINSQEFVDVPVFITTKVWITQIKNDQILESVQTSLEKLGRTHVDLLLLHGPVKNKLIESWGQMEAIHDMGKAKMIGVSNYGINDLRIVLDNCRIMPCVNQIEVHPFFPRTDLVNYCNDNGIQIVAHTSLCQNKRECIENGVLVELCSKYGINCYQLLLIWALKRGFSIIPGTSDPDHVISNFNIVDRLALDYDFSSLDDLNKLCDGQSIVFFPKYAN